MRTNDDHRSPTERGGQGRAVSRLVRSVCAVLATCGLALSLGGGACQPKVPIVDIGAFFSIADATWFEGEQTLFLFYRVESQQGLSDFSEIELSYLTDEEDQAFAPLEDFAMVHQHVAAECGRHSICGSASIHIPVTPRQVQVRLRYHRDGALTLDAPLAFQVVGSGDAHTNRSAIVYGVFDEDNTSVQWRLRNQFPTIRNEEATRLGLRRRFIVDDTNHGSLPAALVDLIPENPYGYGAATVCPEAFESLEASATDTFERARFMDETLGLETAPSALVCGNSTVFDALGAFSTIALAQKNPQVDPAVAELRTPIRVNTKLELFLEICGVEIVDQEHRDMQLQRLLLDEGNVVCVDDFQTNGFADRFAESLQARIDVARVDGDDMVFVIGLNRSDNQRALPAILEDILAQLVDEESQKSSPRLTGAFVFDSDGYGPTDPLVNRHVIWCPSRFGGDNLEEVDPIAARACAVVPDNLTVLGPIKLASLPILPTRRQFRTFVDEFGVGQTGEMRSLSFRAPVRTPLSIDVPFGDFGISTFFNNEAVTARPTDSFSFCASSDVATVVFLPPPDVSDQPLPLAVLPEFHAAAPQDRYAIGLAWDFPYLARLRYDVVTAASITVQDFTVPFGLASPAESFEGSGVWFQDRFDLRDVLLRCDRFCAHPVFDSSGVYNVRTNFRDAFRSQCYRPSFPRRGDGGFPNDP